MLVLLACNPTDSVTFGLLPAALSTGVGSDTQKPFALVIVGGLFSRLLISVYLMPVLYSMSAREDDHLEV
jgi:cobalt-zinc-cadmium resistance protein CzcA